MKYPPKQLFVVVREPGTENEYLFATTDLEDIENGEVIGRYNLDQYEKVIRTVKTETIVKRKVRY